MMDYACCGQTEMLQEVKLSVKMCASCLWILTVN